MKIDMRISIAAFLVAVLAVTMLVVTPINAGQGNGLPSGKHYTLNLLGKTWEKGNSADSDDPYLNPVVKDNDNGHRIFVKLNGKTKILLYEDTEAPFEFAVLDCDGTDGKASFMLPDPGAIISDTGEYVEGAQAYKIFVRVLGPPQGDAQMWTGTWYYEDVDGDGVLDIQWLESTEVIMLDQTKRPPHKFEDITQYLTTLYLDTDGDGIGDTRISLFDDAYEGYYWDYDNNGLKHIQLRFYPTELFPE